MLIKENMRIGSIVIHSGEKWINQVRGTQHVWGIKESSQEDEASDSSENQKQDEKKSFEELLKEELNK